MREVGDLRELVPLGLRGETRQNTRQNCPNEESESRGFSPTSIPVAWGSLLDLASPSFSPSHEQGRLTPEARERHGCCSHGAAGAFSGGGDPAKWLGCRQLPAGGTILGSVLCKL